MTSHPKLHQRGFSLVEVLVVLTITSILTVLTVSSVASLRSTSLTASGNQIVDVVAMARQNSISKNAYTAIFIKSQGTGAYSAYCLMELTRQDDGSFGAWTAITPWKYLGQGIVFGQGAAFLNGKPVDNFTSSDPTLPTPLPSTIQFQGQPINPATATVYQCYQPDGTLIGGLNSSLRLRLIQGRFDPTSGTFTYQGSSASGQLASYYDLIFVGNTGVTKIERP